MSTGRRPGQALHAATDDSSESWQQRELKRLRHETHEAGSDYSDDEGETSGMQIASPEELEPSGFEDVDLSEMQSED